ncbi:unnamed protein product, partial [Schistosoma mattheei]
DDSTLSSPVEGLKVIHEDLPSINETNLNNNINDDKRNDDESHSPSSSSSTPAGSPPVTDVTTPPPAAALLLRKRLGVSGESMKCAQELVYHDKDANSRRQIREALRSNDLIKNLDAVQLQEVVSCMHEQTVPANCYIIREGDDGGHLYVGEEGEFEVSKGGKRLYIMGAGRCFGELALLYNCKRTASVKVLLQDWQNSNPALTVDGEQIDVVEKFVYLGSCMSAGGGVSDEINARIVKVRAAYVNLDHLCHLHDVSLAVEGRIYKRVGESSFALCL